jgi:predicted nucleic acid-binding protein
MRYLLDSTVVIDWLNGIPEAAALLSDLVLRGHTLALNAAGVAEIYSGLAEDELRVADQFVDDCEYWDFSLEDAVLAGAYRYKYARQGITLSVPDMLMAAQAVSRDATLVTGNIKHFPMPELKLLRLSPS